MTELKTLKDIPSWDFPLEDEMNSYPNGDGELFKGEDLRAEAIKWIKFYKQQVDDGVADDDYVMSGRIKSLMSFFNITEEDLK